MTELPIVSELSSVYGLSGISTGLIKRLEIVKGPSSTLYGSEAMGGVINIITNDINSLPKISADINTTSELETTADVSYSMNAGEKATTLLGVNYFNYNQRVDINHDGFTDVTLQNRYSVFNKWSFKRKTNLPFNFAARYLHENRWGGDMNWSPK